MSDIPENYRERLDLREQIARIDRSQAEIQKLLAEAAKFNQAEAQKLFAEAHKFNRDRWVIPLTVLGAILAAIVARGPELLHAFGVG